MRKLKPIFVAIVVVIVFGSMYYMKHSSYAHGRMLAMGVMGQGMMGGSQSAEQEIKGKVDSSHANVLLNYIHDQGLPCLQCHAASTGRFGPSFASVSIRYANVKNAASILSDHIQHGIGRMPSRLANNTQAKQLAKLILELTDSNTKN